MTTEHDHYLSTALAYMEIGRIASSAETIHKSTAEYSNAVAYQLFHAVELFYKLMIKRKKGKAGKIHDLQQLEDEYSMLYPDVKYRLCHPFDFQEYQTCPHNENELELAQNHMQARPPVYMDQHLRYPFDDRTGGYSFSFDASIFESLKSEMLRIAAAES